MGFLKGIGRMLGLGREKHENRIKQIDPNAYRDTRLEGETARFSNALAQVGTRTGPTAEFQAGEGVGAVDAQGYQADRGQAAEIGGVAQGRAARARNTRTFTAQLTPAAQAAGAQLGPAQGYDAAQATSRGYRAAGVDPNRALGEVGQGVGFNNALIDRTEDRDFRASQQRLTGQLEAQAEGQGPTLAQTRLQAATDQNIANQMALLSSQRQSGNVGLGIRQAARNIAATGQQAALQQAELAQSEQMAARQQLAGVQQAARAQDIGVNTDQARLQQEANRFLAEAENATGARRAELLMQAQQFSAAAQNSARQFGADAANRANLANAASANQALQFGAGAGNEFALRQAGLTQEAALANQQALNQFALQQGQFDQSGFQFNAAQANEMSRFNAQLAQQMGLANMSAENQALLQNAQFGQQMNLANLEAANQAAQFSAAQANNMGQFNAQLAQQMALANMQGQNQFALANQQAALEQQRLNDAMAQFYNQNLLGIQQTNLANRIRGNEFGSGLTVEQARIAQAGEQAQGQRFGGFISGLTSLATMGKKPG